MSVNRSRFGCSRHVQHVNTYKQCTGSTDYHLTTEIYQEIIKNGWPGNSMKLMERTAEIIREAVK